MKTMAKLSCIALGAMLLLLAGCQIAPRDSKRPARTKLAAPLVVVPVEQYGHALIVTTSWDRRGPYHFLIDTGSSLTHVSPELANRYRVKNAPPTGIPPVRVRSANGDIHELPTTVIEQIKLGDAHFEDVPVSIYDCSALSAHFGVKIDGILGFSLFRDTRLTLDYPQSRVILAPARPAVLVGTLTGDHLQESARLNSTLQIGNYTVPEPIVYLNESLNSIGGGLLRHFSITFDQTKKNVTFYREARAPVTVPSKRSTGLSFSKTPAYWRVAGVVPDSPATWANVQAGDLISRINGEPVAQWSFQRYERLIAEADEVT